MTREKARVHRSYSYVAYELCYYVVLGGLALMVPLIIMTTLWLMPAAQAANDLDTYGADGVLHVRGALTESACRLEMDSARQDIRLGDIGTAQLRRAGDRGEPVAFSLRLRDCLRSVGAGTRDERTGSLSWSPYQPAVTIGFSAPADADNPQLVKLVGVSGIGLRVTDAAGRDARLGERGAPLLLEQGNNVLTYKVAPERTPAPLRAGAYAATIDFRLNYD
ncbi:fimbrial protein [Serratia marcescens]|uniref:fimbrial protein n=1 Tax=Serratia marcescens TaxID=615 RepID=UPI0032047790